MKRSSVPLRVDYDFYAWAKEMIQKDPSLNQRKITNNIAQKKVIIGEVLFNPTFEEEIYKELKRLQRK